jgi:hypothetical protein
MKRIVYSTLLVGFALPALAQEHRATLLGQVLDGSKAAVPTAVVKATKQDTNIAKETVTNEQGIYSLIGLEPGAYNVTFSKQGFQTARRNS